MEEGWKERAWGKSMGREGGKKAEGVEAVNEVFSEGGEGGRPLSVESALFPALR